MQTDTLLLAVDLDAHPELLAKEAGDLAKKLSARVVLLHVMPVKPSVDADVLANPAAHPVAAKQFREEEEKVKPQLRALVRELRDAGIEVAAHVAHGDVADCILHVAAEVGAGLIVVGTHGRRGIARIALGSVAEAVVRESSVPVVTIRAGVRPAKNRVMFHEVKLDDDRS